MEEAPIHAFDFALIKRIAKTDTSVSRIDKDGIGKLVTDCLIETNRTKMTQIKEYDG
ncbi:MAG: hypothetical protein LBQ88_15350 [Treponema sp.]|jgi:hypothetical protein|nr:hypothetical protein [Treponema sp.]